MPMRAVGERVPVEERATGAAVQAASRSGRIPGARAASHGVGGDLHSPRGRKRRPHAARRVVQRVTSFEGKAPSVVLVSSGVLKNCTREQACQIGHAQTPSSAKADVQAF